MALDPDTSWLAEYSNRLAKAADDSIRAGSASADRWARRALSDQEWSIDTVTADAIADWEEFTPLLGRWLDLWLEAAQRPFQRPPSQAGGAG